MRSSALAARIAAFALALAVALPVEAYVRSQVPGSAACLYWGKRTITWYLNAAGSAHVEDGSDVDAAIASFRAWNAPGCSDLRFELAGTTTRRDVGYDEHRTDNLNLVVWREDLCTDVVPASDPCWSCLDRGGPCCPSAHGCWGHALGAIAVTTTTFHRSSGLLVDADVELNGARYWFTTGDGPPCEERHATAACTTDGDCQGGRVCIRDRCRTEGCTHTDIGNTLTHEVGHVLGLDHTPIREATMYASAPMGEIQKRDLHADDVQGLCDIYPTDGPTLTCLADQIVIVPLAQIDATPRWWDCTTAGGRGWGGLGLVLAGGLLWLGRGARRRRRRPEGRGRRPVARQPALAVGALTAALTWGEAPGDLETWLAAGESVAVLEARGEPLPCGAQGRPAVQAVQVVDALTGDLARGPTELLLVPGEGEALEAGAVALAVVRPVAADDGAGCATVPAYVLHQAGVGLRADPSERGSWSAYVAAVRALPAGGTALETGRIDLWIDALGAEAETLRRHAARSLAETAARDGLSSGSLGRLLDLAAGPDRPVEGRLLALEVAGPALAPAAIGRLVGDPKPAVAEAAAWVVLERADASGAAPWLARLAPALDAAWRERHATPVPAGPRHRTALAAALAATRDARGREQLVVSLDDPEPALRALAAAGLGRLAAAGDDEAAAALHARLAAEEAPEVRSRLEAAIAAAKSSSGGGGRSAGRDDAFGLRIALVALGALALVGMAMLPAMAGRGRRSAPAR